MNEPILTIGLVVRNGQAHLQEAVDSLLAQSFHRFVLVVYDNASTDHTPHIVQSAALRDARVRLVHHKCNVGALHDFVRAAEDAKTKYFCWATHDDLREPNCLEELIGLLESNPWADLATCAARDIDPDGTAGDVRNETLACHSTSEMSPTQRIRMLLRHRPCTPMYGVFRTIALKSTLPSLRANERPCLGAIFGGDVVFLSAFLREHHMVGTTEPLLRFRRGGFSHDFSRFGGIRHLIAEYAAFVRRLWQETSRMQTGVIDRILLSWARTCMHTRIVLSSPMRQIMSHIIVNRWRSISRVKAWIDMRSDPAFRVLRSRLRMLRRGSTLAVFGAGKHTQRHFLCVKMACSHARVHLVSVVDDLATSLPGHASVHVLRPAQWAQTPTDVLLVSSDAYESAMFRHACEFAPHSTSVWCLYDRAIEGSRLIPTNLPNPGGTASHVPPLAEAAA